MDASPDLEMLNHHNIGVVDNWPERRRDTQRPRFGTSRPSAALASLRCRSWNQRMFTTIHAC